MIKNKPTAESDKNLIGFKDALKNFVMYKKVIKHPKEEAT